MNVLQKVLYADNSVRCHDDDDVTLLNSQFNTKKINSILCLFCFALESGAVVFETKQSTKTHLPKKKRHISAFSVGHIFRLERAGLNSKNLRFYDL